MDIIPYDHLDAYMEEYPYEEQTSSKTIESYAAMATIDIVGSIIIAIFGSKRVTKKINKDRHIGHIGAINYEQGINAITAVVTEYLRRAHKTFPKSKKTLNINLKEESLIMYEYLVSGLTDMGYTNDFDLVMAITTICANAKIAAYGSCMNGDMVVHRIIEAIKDVFNK